MKQCLQCGDLYRAAAWECPACGHVPDRVAGFLSFAPDLDRSEIAYAEEHFARLARLEPDNFWFRARNRLIVWALQRHFPDARNLLEVGCGTGFVLSGIQQALPEISLSGGDAHTRGLVHARNRAPNAQLYQMDVRRIPFSEEFDVVGAFDVLEHVQTDEAVLAQVHAALRPGGGILVTVPHHPALWTRFDAHAGHVRRYTRRDLREKLQRAGFRRCRTIPFVTLLLPAMIAARKWPGRRRDESFDVLADLEVGPALNGAFKLVLDLERVLIRLGLRWPWGGSLLAIAEKAGG